jgi:hypothetical protein
MGSYNIRTIGWVSLLPTTTTPPERFGFGGGFEQIHTPLLTTYYHLLTTAACGVFYDIIIWGDIRTRMDASFFRCTTGGRGGVGGGSVVMVDIQQPPNPY